MLNHEQITLLDRAVRRIYALPITRSTFRELQNAILNVVKGDTQTAQRIVEMLITGKIDGKAIVDSPLADLSGQFSTPIWVSKDVHDKGDFLNLITTDLITQEQRIFFSNRIRRIDGTELYYISDVESTLQTVFHFLSRLQESTKTPSSVEQLKKLREGIAMVEEKIEEILATVER